MIQILEQAVSIICLFIAHKKISSDKYNSNKQVDDPFMISMITFFVLIPSVTEKYYAFLIALATGLVAFFVKKLIIKLKNGGS